MLRFQRDEIISMHRKLLLHAVQCRVCELSFQTRRLKVEDTGLRRPVNRELSSVRFHCGRTCLGFSYSVTVSTTTKHTRKNQVTSIFPPFSVLEGKDRLYSFFDCLELPFHHGDLSYGVRDAFTRSIPALKHLLNSYGAM